MEIPKICQTMHSRPPVTSSKTEPDPEVMRVATELEATFLSEMLKLAGLSQTSETFGGGIGEDQFSSFLRDIQAQKLAESGGIGLAERIYQSLKESGHAG